MKSIKSILLAVILFASTTACDKYLDINVDPNNPTVADLPLVLPSGQAAVSFVVGGQFNILGSILAQHWTISRGGNQYRAWDQFNITSGTFDAAGGQFVNLNSGALQDLQTVINVGTTQNEWRMVGIAKIMKAYTFHVLTDLYGDIPFSEALNADLTVTARYDKQEDVYKGLQTLLDEAKTDLAKKQGRFPGAADLVYKAGTDADMDKWTRLANTLKLKFYLRLSQVDPSGSKAGVQTLYTSANEFLRAGESFQFVNATATNTENPFWQANFRLPNNLTVSKTTGDLLTASKDPRLPVYALDADLRTPEIDYVFVPNGTLSTATPTLSSYPGKAFIGQRFTNGNINGTAGASGVSAADDNAAKARPTIFMSYEESLFIRAEVLARSWATSTDKPETLYANGITASMARYGVPLGTYLSDPAVDYAKQTNKIRAIVVQKYLALYGSNGMEAWNEYRRTGFPELPLPTTNVTGGKFMKRLPYVDSELQRNPSVQQTGIAPGDVTTPVWWDKD
ncbi:MAG: SusD/RagB family nutrient-binding outer membrane lipoprotein [Sphingobacteriaceae bacterium]|nr:SusD/RagB family nutrient-binding outer membrane lipoprotein [Cytophagaceae bacterium]